MTSQEPPSEVERLEAEVLLALDNMQPSGSARWVWRIAGGVLATVVLVAAYRTAYPPSTSSKNTAAAASTPHAHPEEADAHAEEKTRYTCGMHPEIVQDEPGTCPICGMNLTPLKPKKKKTRRKQVTGVQACEGREVLFYQAPMDPTFTSPVPGKSPMGMDLVPVCESDEEETVGGISVDSRVRQNMGIRTEAVTREPLRRTIRAVGHVDYNERRIAVITTKVDGWIEDLRVDFTGQSVKKGDPLFALYSPQLVSTQEELLSAHREWKRSQSASDLSTLEAARRRLRYWDISAQQIAALEAAGVPSRTLIIEAPMDGVVMHKTAVDGKFTRSGTDLFRIADLSRVWVYSHLYEMDAPFVDVGAEVQIHVPYDGGEDLTGRVDYVFPWLDAKTREVKTRIVLDNPDGRLKPEMYVHVNLTADLGVTALLVDDSAVLRTGIRNVVFVETEPGLYEAREITLGRQASGKLEVLSGLAEGDAVVVKGQFMLDSESRLKEALSRHTKAPAEGDAEPTDGQPAPDGHDHAGHETAVQKLDALAEKGCTHTCPMESHFHICGEVPGECPECGMTLREIDSLRPVPEESETGTGAHQHHGGSP